MRVTLNLMACGLVSVLLSTGAQAGLLGKTLDATYYYPDSSTSYGSVTWTPPSFVIGAGVETVGDVEGLTNLVTDFSDAQLVITLNTSLSNPTWNTTSFNGIVFALQSTGSLDIASATVDPATTMSGFDSARVSFTNGVLGIDWNGLSYADGQQVVVNFAFNTTPVPEPSTYGLLAAGLVLMGSIARRRLTTY
ncbi:MAG: PEP-CTERM sorting domain-containing protein [Betaproteobacteria bacterium]